MAAMMILMVVFMMVGPHHGFMGSHHGTPPGVEAPIMDMKTDRTGTPEEANPDREMQK